MRSQTNKSMFSQDHKLKKHTFHSVLLHNTVCSLPREITFSNNTVFEHETRARDGNVRNT